MTQKEIEMKLLKMEAMIDDIYAYGHIPNKKCNICNNEFMFWDLYGTGNPIYSRYAKCPYCGSVERQRMLWFYFKQAKIIPNKKTDKLKLLHFAPEQCFLNTFAFNPSIDYYPVDYMQSQRYITSPSFKNVSAKPQKSYTVQGGVDIMNIPYEDKTFDLIICIHVVECVPDDKKAFSEMKRVLKPGGIAFIMSSVRETQEKTLENPEYNTEELRLKYYKNKYYHRLYGKDFPDRVREVGFNVDVIYHLKESFSKEYQLYGFREQDQIYRLTLQ